MDGYLEQCVCEKKKSLNLVLLHFLILSTHVSAMLTTIGLTVEQHEREIKSDDKDGGRCKWVHKELKGFKFHSATW